MSEMEASEVLDNAKTAIIERGWCKNALVDMDGRLCLLGAIQFGEHGRAGVGVRIHDGAFTALRSVLPRFAAGWNNAPERTFGDVIDALDEARLVAKQREAEVA